MKYCMIVATDINNGIGKNQSIPWHFPEELKYFSKLTKGDGKNAVVMGRKTYESIGKPLPKRLNIVITSQNYTSSENCIFTDINSICGICADKKIETVWIIGGSSIYQKYLPTVDELYLTLINEDYNCDTFFPNNYETYFDKSEIIHENNKLIYKKYFF